ncbi:MAG: GNAT family N-acetyltransferase [Oscillospiraceae bacterium]|nr:GNAT family N-acetyltransferase [Oscillospiraceae bacterium]
MEFTVRSASHGDIGRILEMLEQIGALHRRIRPDVFKEGARKFDRPALESIMEQPGKPILVADGGGLTVGYAMCSVTRRKGHGVMLDGATLFIDDLCVDEAYRGNGIGGALFGACVELARGHGCGTVELNVWEGNGEALSFYARRGMTVRKYGMEYKV